MNVAGSPTQRPRRRPRCVDESCGPADVEVRSERLIGEQRCEFDPVSTSAAIELHISTGEAFEHIGVRGLIGRAEDVMNFERGTQADQVMRLGEDRRHADAAGNQNVLASEAGDGK